MGKIDKTKEKIGVSKLDEQTRKKLFNEFVEAGGQVIKDEKDRGLSNYNRDLQKRFKQQFETEKNGNKTWDKSKPEIKKTPNKSSANQKPGSITLKASQASKNISRSRLFFQRLHIKLRLLIMNVADFTGNFFAKTFLETFDHEYKNSLLSVQIIFNNIFKQNIRLGNKIIDELDKINPLLYEVMELLSNTVDRTVINELLEYYYNFPDVPQETRELQEPFSILFRKLHPLSACKDAILTGFEKAFTLQPRMDKKSQSFNSSNKRKIKNDIYIIFNKLYPRLYWLMCLHEKRILMSDKDVEDTISIPLENKPGKRKKSDPKPFEMPLSNKSSVDESEGEDNVDNPDELIPDSVKQGLALMQTIDNDSSIEYLRKKSPFKSVNKEDKIFLINLLLEEFDTEYSFVLTTNKIKYNNIIKTSDNLEFKTKFANLYNEIGKCKNILNEYANSLLAFEKLKLEKPISSTQYIEYSNRLTAFEKEKNIAGNNAKAFVKAFLEKLCKELKILIDDMEKAKNIVINPEDIVIFEKEIEGEKKLNNKSIKEIITCSYNYALAFIFRLSVNGDLGSGIDFKEDEKKINISDILKTEKEKKNPTDEKETEKEKKTVKKDSILKELDDLL